MALTDSDREILAELERDVYEPMPGEGEPCECGRGVVTTPAGCSSCEGDMEREYWAGGSGTSVAPATCTTATPPTAKGGWFT